MKISLALICKDEEDKIKLWLDNHYNDVDEICILDNGSTDSTKDIIFNYPDIDNKIKLWELNYPHIPYDDSWQEWIPRSVNWWQCTGDYILCIDADEFLEEGWRPILEKYVEDYPDEKRFAFPQLCFWGGFNIIRKDHPKDPGQWYKCAKGYFVKNEKEHWSWSFKNNHCIPLYDGEKVLPKLIEEKHLFHYHYAFGLKENDNRRLDVGGDLKNPNWNTDLKGKVDYEIVTDKFDGEHPLIIRNYLNSFVNVIFLTGHSCSGKTTLAEHLKNKYDFVNFNFDLFEMPHFYKNKEECIIKYEKAFDLMVRSVYGSNNKTIVIDGAHFISKEIYDLFVKFSNKYNIKNMLIFELECDYDSWIKRSEVHRRPFLTLNQTHKEYYDNFKNIERPSNIIKLDSNKPLDYNSDLIINELRGGN